MAKKAKIDGTLDPNRPDPLNNPDDKPKTRAANKVTIELSPKVVSILKQGAAELSVKMPDLLRRLGESPLIEEAADTILGNIAAQALQKLQKWVPNQPPTTPPPVVRDLDDTPDLDGDLDRRDAVYRP